MEYKINSDLLEWTSGKVDGFYGKELFNLENGGFKLIKVSPLSNYPEHIHPDKTEFAFVLEGNPDFVINQINFKSEPKDFFIFPINTKHAIINNTNSECLLLIGSIKG